MSLYSMLAPKGPNGFGYGSTAEDVTAGMDLSGKTFLVTGCNSGLGEETLRVLALRGAKVIAAARTLQKASEACAKFAAYAANNSHYSRGSAREFASANAKLIPIACELSDPSSVRGCVNELRAQGHKLDAIICNAGIMALPKLEKAYDVELQFFTNHIGHFILVTGLLDALGDDGRVVMLSSEAHRSAPKPGIQFDNLAGEKSYGAWTQYGQSKFANILFAKELAKHFVGTKKTANAVHPGVISTNLVRHMNPLVELAWTVANPLVLKSIPQGAATALYVATHPSLAGVSGKYFSDCNIKQPRADAEDAEMAKRLWDVSEQIVARLS